MSRFANPLSFFAGLWSDGVGIPAISLCTNVWVQSRQIIETFQDLLIATYKTSGTLMSIRWSAFPNVPEIAFPLKLLFRSRSNGQWIPTISLFRKQWISCRKVVKTK